MINSALNSDEPIIDSFISTTETTEEQKNTILSILNDCGLSDYLSLEYDEGIMEGENTKGYRIQTKDASNIIMYLTPEKTVYSIKYYGNYLYQNNSVCSNLYDYCFTSKERSSYIFLAKMP